MSAWRCEGPWCIEDDVGLVHYANPSDSDAMHLTLLRCGSSDRVRAVRFVDTMVTCLECIVLGELS